MTGGRRRGSGPAGRVWLAGLGVVCVAVADGGVLEAQEREGLLQPAETGRCEFGEGTDRVTRQQSFATMVVFVVTPRLVCPDGTRIRGDTARVQEAEEVYTIWGGVRYEDFERQLFAEHIVYDRSLGTIDANRNARFVRLSDRTSIGGDRIQFFEAGGTRLEDEMLVTGGRPHATLYPTRSDSAVMPVPDSTGVDDPEDAPPPEAGRTGGAAPDATPFEVDADRFVVRGENYIRATGNVVIRQDGAPDDSAFAGSAVFDQAAETMVLNTSAGMDTEQFELRGDVIRSGVEGGGLTDLEARDEATLVADRIRLAAPIIRLFLPEEVVERIVAVGLPPQGPPGLEEPALPDQEGDELEQSHPNRPVAWADDFGMAADSLEVLVPDERIERVVGVGSARAESSARDSLNSTETPAIARRDWLRGDTVIAHFKDGPPPTVEVGPPLPGEEPGPQEPDRVLDRLVARGNAKMLYRLAASDSALAEQGTTGAPRLALHYVTGSEITMVMKEDGALDSLVVSGDARGIHLEPGALPPSLQNPDTSGVDTSLVDTASVDTTVAETFGSGPARAAPAPPSSVRTGDHGFAGPPPVSKWSGVARPAYGRSSSDARRHRSKGGPR